MSQQPLTLESVLKMFQQNERKSRKNERKFYRMLEASELAAQRRQEEYERQRAEAAEEAQRRREELDRLFKKTNKRISELGSSVGRIVEHMVKGNILDKFQALDYDVTECRREVEFLNKKLGIKGEIDLLLDDGDVSILIEVKTTLETIDVRKHIKRLEKYRLYTNARGTSEKKRFIGAVAGAVVKGDAADFAQENGMYVIVQSGKAFEIVPPPEGFKAKEW